MDGGTFKFLFLKRWTGLGFLWGERLWRRNTTTSIKAVFDWTNTCMRVIKVPLANEQIVVKKLSYAVKDNQAVFDWINHMCASD